MFTIEATTNPDAVEIHECGHSVATLRRAHGRWFLMVPENGSGAVAIDRDILMIAAQFIEDRSQRATA